MQSNKRFGRIQGFLPDNNSAQPGVGLAQPGSGLAQPGVGLAQPGSGVAENTNYQKQSSFRGSKYQARGGGSGAQFGSGGYSRDIGGGDSTPFVGGQPGGVLSISKPGNGFGPNNNSLEQSSTRGTGSMARGRGRTARFGNTRGGGSALHIGDQTSGYALQTPLVDDADINPNWSDEEEAAQVPLQKREITPNSTGVSGSKSILGVNDAGQGKGIELKTSPTTSAPGMSIVQKQPEIENLPANVPDVKKADVGAKSFLEHVSASSAEMPVVNQSMDKKPHRIDRIAGFGDVPPVNSSSGFLAATYDKQKMDKNANASLQPVVRESNELGAVGGNYPWDLLHNLTSNGAKFNPGQSEKEDVAVPAVSVKPVEDLVPALSGKPVENRVPNGYFLMPKEDYRNLRSLSLEMLSIYMKISAVLFKFD